MKLYHNISSNHVHVRTAVCSSLQSFILTLYQVYNHSCLLTWWDTLNYSLSAIMTKILHVYINNEAYQHAYVYGRLSTI